MYCKYWTNPSEQSYLREQGAPEEVLVEDHLLCRARGRVVEGHLLRIGDQTLVRMPEGAGQPRLLGGHEGQGRGQGPQHEGRGYVVPIEQESAGLIQMFVEEVVLRCCRSALGIGLHICGSFKAGINKRKGLFMSENCMSNRKKMVNHTQEKERGAYWFL